MPVRYLSEKAHRKELLNHVSTEGPTDHRSPETILWVDDDLNILDGFRRQFRKQFNIEIALGPEMGLDAIANRGPFAVVISDLRMPGMDGIQFLTAVRTKSPDTVRVMLTGQADLAAAIAAVNQGNIFRFLSKPCTPTVLSLVIEAALEQHRLIVAERQLTEKTLLGCLQVMAEVLGIVEPNAFSRLTRLRRYVEHMAKGRAPAHDLWQFEAAALLSQIGWIALPVQEPDSSQDSRAQRQALAAARMISRIPRIEPVARMIEGQYKRFHEWRNGAESDPTVLGAQMLKLACDFDDFVQRGLPIAETMVRLRSRPGVYNPDLLDALASIQMPKSNAEAQAVRPRRFEPGPESNGEIQTVRLREIELGMVLDEDLRSPKGVCLLGKGQEITGAVRQRLLGLAHLIPEETRFRVRVPPKPVA
jgi:response regulator RpfG family c-di-GMP phosphodiesterase